MKIKRRKRSLYGASSALSDLAFLLIIYFIVIAGFNVNKGFLMNLPAKNSTKLLAKEDIMRFELNEKGDIVYQGKKINYRQAERNIDANIKKHPDCAVLLTVNPLARWQNVVSFVEIAQRLRVRTFSFKMGEAGSRE